MVTHGRKALGGLFMGLSALVILAAGGCDRTPAEPDVSASEADVEPAYAKGGPKGSGSGWSVFDLGALPGDGAARARDVNDDGYVVGVSGEIVEQERAFLFDGVSVIPLSDVGVRSSASAVSNAYPLYVGGSIDDPNVGGRPVRWEIDTAVSPPGITYEFLSDVCGSVVGVNDFGEVVGKEGALTGTPMIWHAGGAVTVIDAPAGHVFEGGTARDINNAGLIALSFYGQDYDRGFLRLAGGSLIELPPQPGDVSSYAAGISEVLANGSVLVAGTTRKSESVFNPVRWTVDASSGEILSTWRIGDNGSSGATSEAGALAGSFENRWRLRPAIWTEAASVQLPLPRGISGGNAAGISPDGRYVAGRADRTQGSRAVLWIRAQ